MSKLMTSVSGVRGVYGESLSPEIVMKYVASFVQMQKRSHGKGSIIVGRDSRTSGNMLHNITGIISLGLKIVDLGMFPRPPCS